MVTNYNDAWNYEKKLQYIKIIFKVKKPTHA